VQHPRGRPRVSAGGQGDRPGRLSQRVFYDGKDLRHFARWGRSIPIEIAVALELGEPPGFDGVRCVDCGNRFRTEFDHVEPRAARGPSSNGNLKPRCWSCHQAKTERDRKAGKLTPPEP
jgi:5-methylcytosine-specific restriction endonuclease McrA